MTKWRRGLLVAAALLPGCVAGELVEPHLAAGSACEWSEARRSFQAAWHELTDEQLFTEVSNACGRVFVGFKEAGEQRGVDAVGAVLTSNETVASMKALTVQLGLVIEHEFEMPHVSAWMPLTLDLVRFLRNHPNVDYLEPIFPGERW